MKPDTLKRFWAIRRNTRTKKNGNFLKPSSHTLVIEFYHVFFRRKIKDRMKTVSVALVLCLNVGVDPPDTIKPHPCAKREAWVDPSLMNPTKVPQKIATNLQKSYEKLQPRARLEYLNDVNPSRFSLFQIQGCHRSHD